jgi:hypothetical protein
MASGLRTPARRVWLLEIHMGGNGIRSRVWNVISSIVEATRIHIDRRLTAGAPHRRGITLHSPAAPTNEPVRFALTRWFGDERRTAAKVNISGADNTTADGQRELAANGAEPEVAAETSAAVGTGARAVGTRRSPRCRPLGCAKRRARQCIAVSASRGRACRPR